MTTNSTAIIFPGQGSQSVGMLADIASQYSHEITPIFEAASQSLGYDLWSLIQQGPSEQLDQTTHTQPALLAASYALWQILQSRIDLQPTMLAGHSLGEYTALVCAKALRFEEALQLVAARGQFMQEAVLPGVGAMAAIIGLDEAIVSNICKQAISSPEEVLSPANFNSIGQVVIAGHKNAVERAMTLAKEQGAKLAVLIPVSVPSHCALMRPAAERLKDLLATLSIQTPTLPILNNVDVMCYDTADSIRTGLVRQLYMPVRWVEIIQQFAKQNITRVIECGPGKVLTGLNKRIDKRLQYVAASDLASLNTLFSV